MFRRYVFSYRGTDRGRVLSRWISLGSRGRNNCMLGQPMTEQSRSKAFLPLLSRRSGGSSLRTAKNHALNIDYEKAGAQSTKRRIISEDSKKPCSQHRSRQGRGSVDQKANQL